MPIAVVIDGAFFIRRFRHSFPCLDAGSPDQVAWSVGYLAGWHLGVRQRAEGNFDSSGRANPADSPALYRTFFYDCPPLTKRIHYPVSKRSINLARSDTALFRLALHERLRRHRKLALRLGRLNEDVSWRVRPEVMLGWLSGEPFEPKDDDFDLDTIQKGVDMRLGLDVASLATKGRVDQIILVAGDADFVPAVKLARREGIDVVLDSMGTQHVAPDLLAHVDGHRICRMTALPEPLPDWTSI